MTNSKPIQRTSPFTTQIHTEQSLTWVLYQVAILDFVFAMLFAIYLQLKHDQRRFSRLDCETEVLKGEAVVIVLYVELRSEWEDLFFEPICPRAYMMLLIFGYPEELCYIALEAIGLGLI